MLPPAPASRAQSQYGHDLQEPSHVVWATVKPARTAAVIAGLKKARQREMFVAEILDEADADVDKGQRQQSQHKPQPVLWSSQLEGQQQIGQQSPQHAIE